MIISDPNEALDAVLKAMHEKPNRDAVQVACLDCGWSGCVGELRANACPVCDARVREIFDGVEPTV